MGRIKDLIQQSVQRFKTYQNLDEEGKADFEQSVESLVDTTTSSVNIKELNRIGGVRAAMEQSGAEDLLDEMKTSKLGVLGERAAAFTPALRSSTRDVLLALSNSDESTDIDDIERRKKDFKRINPEEISPGRQFSTDEVQPPQTGPRTLRRRE